MALLRSLALKKWLGAHTLTLQNIARSASSSVRNPLPGPYPYTERERREAAKKYGLLPHEYKPMPDDGFARGDYPDLPLISVDGKDPFYPWDYPEYRHNYNEPWHSDADIYGADRVNINQKFKVPFNKMLLMFLGTVGAIMFLGFWAQQYPNARPVSGKQLPHLGKVHYTFERGSD